MRNTTLYIAKLLVHLYSMNPLNLHPDDCRVVMTLYDGFDMLDIAGPFAMFSAAGLNPVLIASNKEPVCSIQGPQYVPQFTFDDFPMPESVWVPGGGGDGYYNQFNTKNPLLQWLSDAGSRAKYICSVCNGALIAAAAELLTGYTVTTHWYFKQSLSLFPGITLADGFPRYWIDRNRVTGGGITSGLDESLAVITLLLDENMAMRVQLLNQYAPDPPYRAGTPDLAPPKVMGMFYEAYGDIPGTLNKVIDKFLYR